jgi:hypothetical protein
MPKPLIFDSTPLIYLTKCSLAEHIKDIAQPRFTTESAFEEIVREGKKEKAPEAAFLETLFKEEIIKVREITGKRNLNYVKEMASESEMQPLHAAEAEVLCLTEELNGVSRS